MIPLPQEGHTVAETSETSEHRQGTAHGGVSRVLLIDVIAPLVVFYGLREMGVSQFLALLAGALIPLAGLVHGLVTEGRVSGVRLFVLGTMTLTVAMSLITGSPRVLLIRNAWGMAALGVWMLLTLFARRPFLYEAARVVFTEDRQRVWARNWDRYPPLRRLLWTLSACWGVACLADACLRVVMATTLPIDLVPILDDVLLVVTLATILLVQRAYGRPYLRRNGLRLRGADIVPIGTGDRA